MPAVPTFAEQGLKDLTFDAWNGRVIDTPECHVLDQVVAELDEAGRHPQSAWSQQRIRDERRRSRDRQFAIGSCGLLARTRRQTKHYGPTTAPVDLWAAAALTFPSTAGLHREQAAVGDLRRGIVGAYVDRAWHSQAVCSPRGRCIHAFYRAYQCGHRGRHVVGGLRRGRRCLAGYEHFRQRRRWVRGERYISGIRRQWAVGTRTAASGCCVHVSGGRGRVASQHCVVVGIRRDARRPTTPRCQPACQFR